MAIPSQASKETGQGM